MGQDLKSVVQVCTCRVGPHHRKLGHAALAALKSCVYHAWKSAGLFVACVRTTRTSRPAHTLTCSLPQSSAPHILCVSTVSLFFNTFPCVTDLLEHGFEWTMAHGLPRNGPRFTIKPQPACCGLTLVRALS